MLNVYEDLTNKSVVSILDTYQFDNNNQIIVIPAGTEVVIQKQYVYDFEQRIYFCYSSQYPTIDFRFFDKEVSPISQGIKTHA